MLKRKRQIRSINNKDKRKQIKEAERRATALTAALTTAELQSWKQGHDDRVTSLDKGSNCA
jgi:hypothetical protein